MADPGLQAPRSGPEMLAGAAIPFRFEVTWRSLTQPLGPSSATAAIAKPARRVPVRDSEAKEWEMVLPRMRRPAAVEGHQHSKGMLRTSVSVNTLAPPERVAVPNFAAPTFAAAGGRTSRRWILPAAAAVLAPIALVALRWTEPKSVSPVEPGTAILATKDMGGVGWMSEWASDATGSARGRQISLYRPSMPMSDYRLEFSGRIDRRSLGWIFRAVDSKNYYVGKLESISAGLAITHFAVIRGVEGPHIQRMLTMPSVPGATLRVRLDARGPRFTVYVQNQAVEDWEDDRLKHGGVGFLNEREELGQVGSIQISFPKVGRQ